MKRLFDLSLASFAFFLLSLPFLVTYLLVRFTSKGPVFYWSKRVGQNNKIFLMPKFRSMRVDTPQVATHLLGSADKYLTPVGNFIRKTSLDELPQLLSVFKGDMSLVGPRPALFNQVDLIDLRTKSGVEKVKPGITGWAQINGRDDLPIPIKVDFDTFYCQNQSLLFDIKILFLTVLKVIKRDGVSH